MNGTWKGQSLQQSFCSGKKKNLLPQMYNAEKNRLHVDRTSIPPLTPDLSDATNSHEKQNGREWNFSLWCWKYINIHTKKTQNVFLQKTHYIVSGTVSVIGHWTVEQNSRHVCSVITVTFNYSENDLINHPIRPLILRLQMTWHDVFK